MSSHLCGLTTSESAQLDAVLRPALLLADPRRAGVRGVDVEPGAGPRARVGERRAPGRPRRTTSCRRWRRPTATSSSSSRSGRSAELVVGRHLAQLHPEHPRRLVDRRVRVLGADDDVPARHVRAPRSAPRASRSTPCPRCARASRPEGRAAAAHPVEGAQLELGRRGRGAPEDRDLVQRRREQLGEDRRLRRASIGEVGEEARVLPVRERRAIRLVEVAEDVGERLAVLRRRRRAAAARSSPGSTCASTGSSPTPLEVARRPVDRRVAVLAEASRPLPPQLLDLRPRARVQHVVLRQPAAPRLRDREARRSPSRAVWCASELTRSFTPASFAARACDVAEVEPVRLAVDLEEGAGLDAPSRSRARRRRRAAGRVLIFGGR